MKQEHVPEAIEKLDGWVNRLAGNLPAPIRDPLPDGNFVWRFPDDELSVLLVAKAVRVSSALGGAWELAKLGYTTETGALLRLVGDFSAEIQFMAEAYVEGRETRAQKEFRTQFFATPPRSLDDFLLQEKQYFVARREIAKAHKRLAEKAGQDGRLLNNTSSFIAHGLNRYVHGAYDSAMELFHGGLRRFLTRGVDGRPKASSLKFVGNKATEAVQAVEFVAILFGETGIRQEIVAFLARVDPALHRSRPGVD